MVGVSAMAPDKTAKDQWACDGHDIIRTPVDRDGQQRVLAVCARCGAFRDVTGVPVSRLFHLLHEDWEFNDSTLRPPGRSG